MEKSDVAATRAADPTLSHEPSTAPSGAGFDRWWILVIVIVGLIGYLVFTQPDVYGEIVNNVSDGIGVTIQVTVVSFLIVLVGGLVAALGRMSSNWLISGFSTVYVEVVRGIPALVQLIWWYYAFPSMMQGLGDQFNIGFLSDFKADAVSMAIFGLAFCYSAYMSEVYRAGIQSIPRGQMEAARSLGMSHFQAMRYIIIPQAVRVILPPVGNEFISLLKDSSLVSVVAVADITRRGREHMAATFTPLETWVMVALIYLTMTLLSARLVTWIEHKTRMEK